MLIALSRAKDGAVDCEIVTGSREQWPVTSESAGDIRIEDALRLLAAEIGKTPPRVVDVGRLPETLDAPAHGQTIAIGWAGDHFEIITVPGLWRLGPPTGCLWSDGPSVDLASFLTELADHHWMLADHNGHIKLDRSWSERKGYGPDRQPQRFVVAARFADKHGRGVDRCR